MSDNIINLEKNIRTPLGEQIKKIRELRKMTQVELARQLSELYSTNIKQAQVARIESGKHRLSEDTLLRLSVILGFNINLVPKKAR